MKEVLDLLTSCRQKGITLTADATGTQLRAQGATDQLTGEEKEFIRANKAAILTFLTKRPAEAYAPIPLAPAGERYALSSAQRRLWITCRPGPASVAYNVTLAFAIEGQLDGPAFADAFRALIDRHESLRTVFREEADGEVYQVIMAPEAVGFAIDFRDLRATADARHAVEKDFATPFDLANGPLLRAGLYQVANDRWVFSFVVHHIVSDGWSLRILIRELLHLYAARATGQPAALPPLLLQYKDYAAWQRGHLQTPATEAHRAYWLRQFEGELPVLDLAGERARPASQTYAGRTVSQVVAPSVVQGLRALCQEHGSTLFMGLLAGVYALLYRYTGQSDVVVGSPVAGREHADLAGQIGFYVNTLPLRARFSGAQDYIGLLDEVRRLTLEAYQHQSFPFDELVAALPRPRDTSRAPLFDVWVVLHNESEITHAQEQQRLPDLRVAPYPGVEHQASRRDLSFSFAETAQELTLTLTYNCDIYSADLMAQLARHYEQLLDAAISEPARSLQQLDYLGVAETRELLGDLHLASPTLASAGRTIPDWFEEQARQTPDRVAVVAGAAALTYQELDEQANRLAHHLREQHGVGTGERVGIQLERNEQLIISILAVLKSGAAYVPLDPEYPQERRDYLLRDSQCRLLLDAAELARLAPAPSLHGLSRPMGSLLSQHPAYVIYTSGSTGQPKGVVVSHGALTDYCVGILERTNLGDCQTFGLVSTPAADLGHTVLFPALLTGGTLHVFAARDVMSPERMAGVALDGLKITPSHWKALQDGHRLFAPRKCLVFGGEALTADVLALLRDCPAPPQVYNHYGPTETTVGKLTTRLPLTGPPARIALGTPIGRNRVYVLDQQQQPVPRGVVGEICIAGAGLADGYLGQPDLTAEKFPADPFVPGERMYRTGDLGRRRSDLAIEFVGRTDDQVKIRGYRVEPGEVERVLTQHNAVTAAAVLAQPDTTGELRLAAFVAGPPTLDLDAVRQHLEARLPAYMVPACFVRLDHLPLTANGKVDKRQLEVPALASEAVATVAPRTPTEAQLAVIWGEVLGLHAERIGVRDDFFDLGGHSLKAIKIVLRVHEQFGVEVDLDLLFNEPTIEQLATEIDNVRWLQGHEADPVETAGAKTII
jgi:amino acid adenylation domain-containing protein